MDHNTDIAKENTVDHSRNMMIDIVNLGVTRKPRHVTLQWDKKTQTCHTWVWHDWAWPRLVILENDIDHAGGIYIKVYRQKIPKVIYHNSIYIIMSKSLCLSVTVTVKLRLWLQWDKKAQSTLTQVRQENPDYSHLGETRKPILPLTIYWTYWPTKISLMARIFRPVDCLAMGPIEWQTRKSESPAPSGGVVRLFHSR